jgi:hypothetical protein
LIFPRVFCGFGPLVARSTYGGWRDALLGYFTWQ